MASLNWACARAAAALVLLLGVAGPRAARSQGLGPCPGPSLIVTHPPPASTPWTDRSLPPERRAELILGAMALEEKIDLATGEWCLNYGFYNAPIDRLGIPALTMADGPAGIRIPYQRVNGGRATQLPAPIAVAASWDLDLARAQGEILGQEAFATGHNVLLGPTLDLARQPLAGRTFEGLGEDPLLASRFAVPFIQGIQESPVLADAKHFAMYGQETDRFTLDAQVDEQTMRELYLRPFEAAVRDAHVATVMCGFNRVNGVYNCEDPLLLGTILKGEMGFEGFVLSDFGGSHAGSAVAGLDMELAREAYFGHALLDAVSRGDVPAGVVDEKARRILTEMFRFGLFDHPVVEAPLPEQEHGRRAREIAEQGAVLLKDAGGILPLDAGALQSIAVIGADAANATAQGGGAARVEPTYTVSPLDGIRQRAGTGVRVEYAPGTDPVVPAHLLAGPPAIPSSVLEPTGSGAAHGLLAQYWSNPNFDGDPDLTRVERQVAASSGFFSYPSINAASVPPVPAFIELTRFSARWSGTLTAPATGDYALTLTCHGQGWLYLDGAAIFVDGAPHPLESQSATIHLVAGEAHQLRVDYSADDADIGVKTDLGGDVVLGWQVPPGTLSPDVRDAAALAAASDVAVVVVRDYGTEERDRPDLSLPNDQDAMIRAVVAANPRTIVVLTTGQPTDMPWLETVPAVLEAWYPGQEQGNVIARILFGDVNPSGKLPITFPRTLDQTPTAASPQRATVGDAPAVRYSEGLLVGYRWYDAKGLEPLFPFGFGLSYTTFGYDKLSVDSNGAGAGAQADGAGAVSFTVTNTGTREGAEVAQLYVGSCPGDGVRPQRQLAGFAKVRLAPGETQRVRIAVAPESLSTWDTTAKTWVTPTCEIPLYVGSSSRDVRLQGTLGRPDKSSATHGSGGCGEPGGGVALAMAAALMARRRRRNRK